MPWSLTFNPSSDSPSVSPQCEVYTVYTHLYTSDTFHLLSCPSYLQFEKKKGFIVFKNMGIQIQYAMNSQLIKSDKCMKKKHFVAKSVSVTAIYTPGGLTITARAVVMLNVYSLSDAFWDLQLVHRNKLSQFLQAVDEAHLPAKLFAARKEFRHQYQWSTITLTFDLCLLSESVSVLTWWKVWWLWLKLSRTTLGGPQKDPSSLSLICREKL